MSSCSEDLLTRDIQCYCGRTAVLKTSWTNNNPGRRFRTCSTRNERGGGNACQFFTWVDPPICARAGVIIPGLLRKLRKRDEEIAGLKKRSQIMGVLLFFVTVMLLLLVMG
ncbi:DNA-(apurinic or apyrimidinic site) lyase [Handroanthus impetiginosus]|uniref:DNA-(Apurinic or apyrimidinic site) lyase n=1 Tax=Handroanthus impetiginosus TaxID=429701 RepID=A0A2G9HT10_9LAMI|nr:DNA-(apurinic or apyrimidinic site) lyase [Handroanthus impetiginosus]